MDFCPICGARPNGAHVCAPKQMITSVPANEFTCPDCGKSFPSWDGLHMCNPLRALRSSMYGKEAPVDVDTVNEMRVKSLEQAVLLVMQQGGRDVVHDVAVYADSFFKFLMGESQ